MRKQIVCTLLIGAMLIGGCGNVKFSYGEAGMKDYDSAEDLENDLEARMNEAQLQKELEEELGEAAEENESSGFLGGLFNKERKVDGYHVTIAGDEYDLRLSGEDFIGEMVKNGVFVMDTQSHKCYEEDGHLSENNITGSSDNAGYNDAGYIEKYFDGADLKSAYCGKFLYAHAYDESNPLGWTYAVYFNRRTAGLYNSNKITKYTTPDGYSEKSKFKDFEDDDYWLQFGFWGEVIENPDNYKCSTLFVDGEQIKLSDYCEKVDNIMKENELETIFDFAKYMRDIIITEDSRHKPKFGAFLNYDPDNLEPYEYIVPHFESEDHKNAAAMNLALYEALKKFDAGEVESITYFNMEWDIENPDKEADLVIVEYNK